MKPLRLTLIAAASCWLLASCGGSDNPPPTPAPEPAPAPVAGDLLGQKVLVTLKAAELNALIASQNLGSVTGNALCDVNVVALDYATTGALGEDDTNATGVMLVPGGADPACTADAPLLAYARGTDPNKNRTLANPQDSETFMLAAFFAAQGYAVVATDYLGYAGSNYRFHPYLHADSEASAVLDSVRAARQAAAELGAPLSGQVLFSGYSQGGHASMAAQRAAESQPQEFKVLGGAHLAGPYNLTGAMQMEQAIAGYQLFVPFMVTAWQQVYGNLYDKVQDVFLSPYAESIEGLLPSPDASMGSLVLGGKLPGGTPDQARAALFTPAFLQQLQSTEPTPIGDAAAANSLMDYVPQAPVLLCGGAGDPTIPPAVHQNALAKQWQDQGFQAFQTVDVDPQIQLVFGTDGKAPADPTQPEFAAYYGAYHGSYEPIFCLAAARQMFDALPR